MNRSFTRLTIVGGLLLLISQGGCNLSGKKNLPPSLERLAVQPTPLITVPRVKACTAVKLFLKSATRLTLDSQAAFTGSLQGTRAPH